MYQCSQLFHNRAHGIRQHEERGTLPTATVTLLFSCTALPVRFFGPQANTSYRNTSLLTRWVSTSARWRSPTVVVRWRPQKSRLKEEQQKELQGDVKMVEGDLIARVRYGVRCPLNLTGEGYLAIRVVWMATHHMVLIT